MSGQVTAETGNGLAATDAEWYQVLHRHLAGRIPEVIPGGPALFRLEPLTDDVWLARLSDGGQVVVKHQFFGLLTGGLPYDLLQVEVELLKVLRRAGCAVPLVFGSDPEAQVIFLEFAGPRTLAHVLAEPPQLPRGQRTALTGRLFSGLAQIEDVLARDERWQDRVVPGGERQELARAWEAATCGAAEGLGAVLSGGLGARGDPGCHAEARLRELARSLGRRPPSLGSTDYQPGNVVLDDSGERLTFLEQGKLGWDWTERRAVQYTTWVPAPDRDGLIDVEAASRYGDLWSEGEGKARRRALDGHHLIFHLLWTRRLGLPEALGTVPEALAAGLATPLSDDPLAGEVRGRIAAALRVRA